MKCRKFIFAVTIAICLLADLAPFGGLPVLAQSGYKDFGGKVMPYIIEGGDTVFLSPIAAARVYEKKQRNKGREWRKYYRLVYNFAKVYPYSVAAKGIIAEVDSTIHAEGLRYVKKDVYVGKVVKGLFNAFEQPMRDLTISQGELLMKLIDRECGITPYEIIREFKNKYAAGFWQGIAKLFGNDLKKPYDPKGDDAKIEDLVDKWHKGTFEQLYYETFWKYPPMVEIPERYNKPDTKYRN